jgi:hypothetical protein
LCQTVPHRHELLNGGQRASAYAGIHEHGIRPSGVRAVVSVVAGPTSSFTLTDAGRDFAARLLAVGGAGALIGLPMGDITPRYHALPAHRVLSWGVHTLKRYRQCPGNQELILAAAEELQWPALFDNPLPRPHGVNSKLRAYNTVGDLNRSHKLRLMQFHVNRAGTQIGWELR